VHCVYNNFKQKAIPWLRLLVTGLSPQGPRFMPRWIYVTFALDRVPMGWVFPNSSVFPSVSFHHDSPHPYIIWEMKTRIFVPTVQRRSLTPSAWTTTLNRNRILFHYSMDSWGKPDVVSWVTCSTLCSKEITILSAQCTYYCNI
jgi:hypothetical protein